MKRSEAAWQIVRVTDVETALRVLEEVHPEHGQQATGWLQRQGSNL